MENESTNHQDVADPDQMASGVAGTGHEYQNKNGITGKSEGNSSQRISKNSVEFFSSSGSLRPSQTSKSSVEFFSSSGSLRPSQTSKSSVEFFSSSGSLRPSQTSKSSVEFFSSSRFPGTFQTGKTKREIIGLGVLYNGPMNAGKIPDTGHSAGKYVPEDPPESAGDLIFCLYERQERIADRLNKKIARLDRRLTKIEERGRS